MDWWLEVLKLNWQEIVSLMAIVGGLLTYAHTRFATKDEMDQAEKRGAELSGAYYQRNREYFTQAVDRVEAQSLRMESTLNRIEDRLWSDRPAVRAPANEVRAMQSRGRLNQ
jgi:hypothetical protein